MIRLKLAFAAMAVLATPALSAPCRDAEGHFVKCTVPAAKPATTKCRDSKGHFAKCTSPGAKPA